MYKRQPKVESATGFSVFEEDIIFRPKKIMEKANNLKHWNTFKNGGHFAPMEQPKIIIDEIRKFFKEYRTSI